MKKTAFIILGLTLFAQVFAFEKPFWNFYSTTDFAYYTKSNSSKGEDHYAPITGAYSGVEFQQSVDAAYTIPLNFSENMLLSGDKLVLDAGLSLTPVSIMPKASVTIVPVAFFTFAAGGSIGTAWELIGIKSISRYDSEKAEYVQMKSFETWYYNVWNCSTLMFDTGAVISGDWTHVVAVASFTFGYNGLLNADKKYDMFQWQTNSAMVDGGYYDFNFILGYQMPLKLNTVGIMCNLNGYLDDDDFASKYDGYNGDFVNINLSPVAIVNFTEKDSVLFLLNFSSRRSFSEDNDDYRKEPLLKNSGREWFFKRIGMSWTHMF